MSDDTHSTAESGLWAVEWLDGALSVLSADSRAEVRGWATRQHPDPDDGRRASGARGVRDVLPVTNLELRVGSRAVLNAPLFCRVGLGERRIEWSAVPLPAAASTAATRAGLRNVWSYVPRNDTLVFFDAADTLAAVDRVRRAREGWGLAQPDLGAAIVDHVESIEALLLHLEPGRLDHRPRFYRAWIEGVRVGWPPPRPDREAAHAALRWPCPESARQRS